MIIESIMCLVILIGIMLVGIHELIARQAKCLFDPFFQRIFASKKNIDFFTHHSQGDLSAC